MFSFSADQDVCLALFSPHPLGDRSRCDSMVPIQVLRLESEADLSLHESSSCLNFGPLQSWLLILLRQTQNTKQVINLCALPRVKRQLSAAGTEEQQQFPWNRTFLKYRTNVFLPFLCKPLRQIFLWDSHPGLLVPMVFSFFACLKCSLCFKMFLGSFVSRLQSTQMRLGCLVCLLLEQFLSCVWKRVRPAALEDTSFRRCDEWPVCFLLAIIRWTKSFQTAPQNFSV